jgi:hypothetical protein
VDNNQAKNMMALYLCVTKVDEKQFDGDFFDARQHIMSLVASTAQVYELGFDSSGSRVAYMNCNVPAMCLINAQKNMIKALKEKLPLGIEVKCFINIDVGMGLMFPLDFDKVDTSGDDYTKRWDYSQTNNPEHIEIFEGRDAAITFYKNNSTPVEPIIGTEIDA